MARLGPHFLLTRSLRRWNLVLQAVEPGIAAVQDVLKVLSEV